MSEIGLSDVKDVVTFNLLVENIHAIDYRTGGKVYKIKCPYFDDRVAVNPAGVREVKARFCAALVQLLESNGRLNNGDIHGPSTQPAQ